MVHERPRGGRARGGGHVAAVLNLLVKGLALLALAAGVYLLFVAVRLLIGSPTASAVFPGPQIFGVAGLFLVAVGIGLAWWGWRET